MGILLFGMFNIFWCSLIWVNNCWPVLLIFTWWIAPFIHTISLLFWYGFGRYKGLEWMKIQEYNSPFSFYKLTCSRERGTSRLRHNSFDKSRYFSRSYFRLLRCYWVSKKRWHWGNLSMVSVESFSSGSIPSRLKDFYCCPPRRRGDSGRFPLQIPRHSSPFFWFVVTFPCICIRGCYWKWGWKAFRTKWWTKLHFACTCWMFLIEQNDAWNWTAICFIGNSKQPLY